MGAGLLYVVATELGDAAQNILADGGCEPARRRFVNAGTAVISPAELDTAESQLTVRAEIAPSSVAMQSVSRSGKCAIVWQARFTISLLRPALTEGGRTELPEPNELDGEAKEHYRDGWQLARGFGYYWTRGLLVPSYTLECANASWQATRQTGPQGGLRGWELGLWVDFQDHYERVSEDS